MRNLITILLLFFVCYGATAQSNLLPWHIGEVVDTTCYCREFDRLSDWTATGGVSLAIGHFECKWVYAEKCDVNPCDPPNPSGIVISSGAYRIPPPCGFTGRDVEARICSQCYKEERRTHTWGREQVKKGQPEYSKLINREKQ